MCSWHLRSMCVAAVRDYKTDSSPLTDRTRSLHVHVTAKLSTHRNGHPRRSALSDLSPLETALPRDLISAPLSCHRRPSDRVKVLFIRASIASVPSGRSLSNSNLGVCALRTYSLADSDPQLFQDRWIESDRNFLRLKSFRMLSHFQKRCAQLYDLFVNSMYLLLTIT